MSVPSIRLFISSMHSLASRGWRAHPMLMHILTSTSSASATGDGFPLPVGVRLFLFNLLLIVSVLIFVSAGISYWIFFP